MAVLVLWSYSFRSYRRSGRSSSPCRIPSVKRGGLFERNIIPNWWCFFQYLLYTQTGEIISVPELKVFILLMILVSFVFFEEERRIPTNIWYSNNVVITLKWRHFDVITSKWRHFDVITTSSLRNGTQCCALFCCDYLIRISRIPMFCLTHFVCMIYEQR